MPDVRYIALLRGINVGGSNVIRMADLKICFEEMGFGNVTTYIQSGNVIFDVAKADRHHLTHMIESRLSDRFGYQSRIVLLTQQQLSNIINTAPQNFGSQPNDYKYDVLFLKEPLTAAEAVAQIRVREGVDRIFEGNGVLYFSRLHSKASQSYLSKLVATPVYKEMTIRNWNTSTRLSSMAAQDT